MNIEQALAYYLTTVTPTGDLRTDVTAALKEAARRRKEGPLATAALIRAAHDQLRMSYRDIEAASTNDEVGAWIDTATAQRIYVRNSR